MRRYRTSVLSSVGIVSLVAGMAITAQPAGAITGGQRDEVHTNVGVVRFTTESGRFRCSGTLISPTVVLTAGHCTGD
ncbi:MAG TPA: trypsin-like serine protease, partial [Nocardioidaceae bacterium]|nr:trypsin-like serine protease [Nocardioidaceae bacterium]